MWRLLHTAARLVAVCVAGLTLAGNGALAHGPDLSRDGMTSVVVTHEMAFARRVADRVVFMESGGVIDDAPTSEFFSGTSSERAKRFLKQILHH